MFRGYDGLRIPDFVKSGNFTVNRESPQARGLVAWWPFVDPYLLQKDYSGWGNDLQVIGGTPTMEPTGPFSSYALEVVRASSEYLELTGVPPGVDGNSNLSFTAWYRPDSVAVHNSWVSIETDASGATRDAIGFHTGGGAQHYSFDSTGGLNTNQGTVVAGEWNFTGATVVYTSSTVADFYHAAPSISPNWATVNRGAVPNDFDRIYVGRGKFNTDPEFAGGGIFDVRIYNLALGRAAIERIHNPATRWDMYKPTVPRSYFFVSAGDACDFTINGPLADATNFGVFGDPV